MTGKMNGGRAMTDRIKKIAKENPRRMGAAIYQEGQIEMTESKKRCPVSPTPAPKGVVPGTLRASGRVSEPIYEGRNISVVLSYGGAGSGAEDYAVPQHENPDYIHTTGQWQYLASVLNESRSSMNPRLAARLHFSKLRV